MAKSKPYKGNDAPADEAGKGKPRRKQAPAPQGPFAASKQTSIEGSAPKRGKGGGRVPAKPAKPKTPHSAPFTPKNMPSTPRTVKTKVIAPKPRPATKRGKADQPMNWTSKSLQVPSVQQIELFKWTKFGAGNAFTEAVAGSGKTTSLLEACVHMKGDIAFTCFNKKIAVEIQNKMASMNMYSNNLHKNPGDKVHRKVDVGTFHSFGFRACRFVYPKVTVDDRAKREAMFIAITPEGMREFPPHLTNVTQKLVSLAKQSGVFSDWDVHDRLPWQDFVDHYGLAQDVEDPRHIDQAIGFAVEGVLWSRRIAPKLMDFDDMVWLPTISNMKVPQFDWVLVDEAQDTNVARRNLAAKMMKSGARALFVGDRHQAIYGFTGADADAVDRLKSDFQCCSLPLTVTYRCPKAVVKEAQKYVKHIQAYDLANEGVVRKATAKEFLEAEVKKLTPDCAILCRNTKPVVSLAFQLIRRGVACHVEGRDIGQGLIKLAQRWKVSTIDKLHEKLEIYEAREVEKLMTAKKETQAEALRDRVETLRILMEGCHTIKQVIDKIGELFQDTEGVKKTVTLSTIHKAKGREWNTVYFLGLGHYVPSKWARLPWEREQENNLIYVAVTRAMKELVYTDHFEELFKHEEQAMPAQPAKPVL